MQHTVVGAFDTYSEAAKAVTTLKANGFVLASVTEAQPSAAAGSAATADTGIMSHVSHFFSGLFSEDEHHAPYAEAVRRGGAVVKVDVDTEDEAERAREALESAGAVDIDERGDQWRAEGWTGGKVPSSLATATPAVANQGAIPVIKEELEVGKRTVSTGGVRVFARTVSTPVSESIDLRSEHAQVQRRPVDRPATAADLNALQDRTIEVRETAERAVVGKTARVVEEISVGKTVDSRTEQINDSVRHTEVEVERLGADSGGYAGYDSAFRSDFTTRYGATGAAYDEYEPAYKYGHGLRSDARYSGRQWSEVEGDARRGWETSHPGSAWDKVKGAVSHAWTSVTK